MSIFKHIVYAITIVAASMFPKAIESNTYLPNPTQTMLQLKQCIYLPQSQYDYYEFSANLRIQFKQEQLKNQDTNFKYTLSMYTTNNQQEGELCPNIDDKKWNMLVQQQAKERKLKCQLESNQEYLVPLRLFKCYEQCKDVPIVKGNVADIFKYSKIQVDQIVDQGNYLIQDIQFVLKKRNVELTRCLTMLKYAFVFVTAVSLIVYWKTMEDLGLIQKWVLVLLLQLLLFDDPFVAIKDIFPYDMYQVVQAITQASFISMILFFWLVIVHSISSNELISIDERRFYMPKIILCFAIWLVLTISATYLNIQQSKDPSFYWRDDIGSFSSTMQYISATLLLLYSSYFIIIAYVAFFQIKEMKKSYKFSLLLTFGVIFICISIMIFSGYQNTQNDSKLAQLQQDIAVVFVAFYSMFNIYMYIISYLYAPTIDSLDDLQFNKTRKEHEQIMSQFYEQELPDISKDMDSSREQLSGGENQHLNKRNSLEKRRYMRKNPEQKAKDKLWESIIKETEEEDDESSDDEHQI